MFLLCSCDKRCFVFGQSYDLIPKKMGVNLYKVIHYRQLEWFGAQEDAVDLITQVLAARPHVNNTEFPVKDETCEIRHRHVAADEIRLHIATHRPGARKGIRRAAIGQASAELGEAEAPENSDFVEREVAIVLRRNRLGFVVSGATFGPMVERIVRGVISMNHQQALANRLVLASRANAAMIAQLLERGVDKLELGLSLPAPDAAQAIAGQPAPLGRALGSSLMTAISARFQNDLDHGALHGLVTANAHLQLNLGRKPSLEEIQDLTILASDAVESGDEFSIRTTDKTEFTRDKLTLKSGYSQPGPATRINHQMAWDRISDFIDTVD